MSRQDHNHWIRPVAIVGFALLLVSGPAKAQEIPYEVKVNYSLAAENYKNEDYSAALPYLRWLIDHAPTVYNGERIHRRAVNSYALLSEGADDDAVKSAYLDTALTILRTAPTTLKDAEAPFNEARWELDFGNFLDRYGNLIAGIEEDAVDHWIKAYELDPAGLDPYYVRKIVDGYIAAGMVDEATEFMEDAEQHFASDSELMAEFDEKRNELFKSPEERIAYLEAQLAGSPDDVDIVQELFGIYGALDMAAKRTEMGGKLLELDPTVETYVEVADIQNEDADYEGAIALYEQALELTGDEDGELKRDLEFKIAQANYDLGRLQSARSRARSALRHDNSFCQAYFLIGDVLAKAVQDSEFEREDRAVYWLAMDYWERAGSADSDCRNRARQKVQQYAEYMPTKEDKFFKGWNEGDSYTIDYGRYSWVGESTHVR